jgi:hypothetical protein
MGKSESPPQPPRPGGRHGRPPIASVSVTLPPEAADKIKKASEERSAAQGSQVTQIDINEEIVRELFHDIEAKIPLIFYPGARRDKSIRPVRKTIWLPVPTVEIVKRYAEGFGLPDSTFILTAILRWFEKQGTTFPGFFGTAQALNILRLTSPEQKMPEPAPIRRRKTQ